MKSDQFDTINTISKKNGSSMVNIQINRTLKTQRVHKVKQPGDFSLHRHSEGINIYFSFMCFYKIKNKTLIDKSL